MQKRWLLHLLNMIRPTLTAVLFLSSILAFGQKNVSGNYKTNFSSYGMFEKTLTLNCDSTVVLNFRGDMMNDNSYGRWKTTNGIIILLFDTVKSVQSRYKGSLSFRIKGKRLYQTGITRKSYQAWKNAVSQHSKEIGEKVALPGFRRFNKRQNRTPRNFYGMTKKQFYKKYETYTCGN